MGGNCDHLKSIDQLTSSYIYSLQYTDLRVKSSKNALSNQNKGHLGSRCINIYIYVYIQTNIIYNA